ncbi:arsenate reductase [Falsiroseomonas sp. E2-1-a20]|uniref:arsenate reductase n=1 Tax=Falsiroseomonas sp. E2-1-a20 TaxID=3239300 RepID=UPI003F3EA18A
MDEPVTLHGIRNCDAMKRALAWLAAHGIAHRSHDYRLHGVPSALLEGWVDRLGWAALLNRAGTTFRKLPDAARQDLDAPRALALMQAQPAMIRRPVLTRGALLLVGFTPATYAEAFAPPAPPA